MADLESLDTWINPLLQRIAAPERAKLARSIAQQLRRSQQQRVNAQRNPDGTPFAPRKPAKLREKQGRVKRKAKMFQKLRAASYMKARGDKSLATVGFTGRVARIARVHQDGLRDRVEPRGPTALYERREILGLTDADHDLIRAALIDHLSL
ncbi:phage virion morphogenesis protein [Pseudomonas sp. Irchel 3E13]|uniref:phage virion morphogenesis protein n=1 Tax=Pseudomonas sp. Irchel 3E13 TaxID=2008975 RepID=UPI000BA4794A|nr:phage virion morphogenesis protein [Pseudomonas sp. Irchel 3E13]